MNRIDLNCDLGESFGVYKLDMDEEILKYITSVNIACGWHAGDPLVMEKTVYLAKENNIEIGAHPGYPDLMGFGRRDLGATPEEVKAYIKYQIGALKAFASAAKKDLKHVKPHGALYNTAAKNYKIALAIAEGIKEVDSNLILLGLANSEMIRAGKSIGLKVASEVFADRAYNDDGSLVDRKLPEALIQDEELAIKNVIKMIKEGKVTSITGKEIEIEVDSICIHGDNPKALKFAKNIKIALEKEGVVIAPIGR
ncbi:MAG: LamB/YcsF family protein [Cetobacterium sp.]